MSHTFVEKVLFIPDFLVLHLSPWNKICALIVTNTQKGHFSREAMALKGKFYPKYEIISVYTANVFVRPGQSQGQLYKHPCD